MVKNNRGIVLPKPFLKWAGGKRQLIGSLVADLPNFNNYYEPFIGGGALFFHLISNEDYDFQAVHISDLNAALIGVYQNLKENYKALLSELKQLAEMPLTREHFDTVRSQYNVLKKGEFGPEVAARFIFLNRTCFNGLYRENSKGEFNVPFGKYKNPEIVNEDNLFAVASCLRRKNISIRNCDWKTAVESATKDDLVYFDPPYDKLNDTSFTSYLKDGFTQENQKALKEACDELTNRNVYFIVSNANTPFIKDLYSNYTIETVDANRAINSKGGERNKQPIEVIIRNFPVRKNGK